MSQDSIAYVAIGSNIAPFRQIPRCLDLLHGIPASGVCAESSWYRTRPWGIETQPDFINLVVGLRTRLSPLGLLRETQGIEVKLKRRRGLKNGPRTIDLDILLFGQLILKESHLQVPHPGLLLRDFMLTPLIEIAPDAVHPEHGLPVSQLAGEIRYRQIIDRSPPAAARDH